MYMPMQNIDTDTVTFIVMDTYMDKDTDMNRGMDTDE
jgi:hypothetical protein